MNRIEGMTKPLLWFLAILLVALVAGCGSGSAAPGSTKAISAYSLGGTTGTINETAKTIAVTVPNGTSVTALVATFTSTGASTKVGTTAQVSGTTANDFTLPKSYVVTAADATTATYIVTVTVAPIDAKAITAYTLAGANGTINETAKTIAVTVPNGTSVTALVATFSSTGASTKVGTTAQVSGTTPNNFSSPVAYTVTAANASIATYTVTVTVASTSSKAITAYSLNGVAGTITGTAISVTLPLGTNVTAQVATFSSTGANVKVGTTVQASGTTPNNFTSPVAYTVTAADATTATYTVTVTLGQVVCGGASGTNCVNLLSAANYAILDEATVTFTPIATITTTPTITGDVAVSPAAATFMTGFALALDPTGCFSTSTRVTGKLYAANYNTGGCTTPADLTTAVGDKNAAYSAALGKAPSGGGLVTACPGTGTFDGGVVPPLAPGVYTCGVNVSIPTNFTLNGNATDVWVFQITGSLSQTGATNVLLTGGALPQNVFWIVSNGVSVGANAHMEGVVMSATNISLLAGASVKGRLLGRTGVLMDSNTVVQP